MLCSVASIISDSNSIGHGITEALRLKNLRSNYKIQKARLRLDKQRWTEEDGQQGSRMDAIIDRTCSILPHTP
jgi:hypothetical protein